MILILTIFLYANGEGRHTVNNIQMPSVEACQAAKKFYKSEEYRKFVTADKWSDPRVRITADCF